MKELSIEEKAKRYDEALERAKSKIKNDKDHVLYEDDVIEIFPELYESEDEEIRKWIIDDIRYNMNNEPLNNSEYKKKAERAIAWLEKQGNNADKVKQQQAIEIPFGAKDSELQEATYYIPEGYHAEINGNEVVIKKSEIKSCKI